MVLLEVGRDVRSLIYPFLNYCDCLSLSFTSKVLARELRENLSDFNQLYRLIATLRRERYSSLFYTSFLQCGFIMEQKIKWISWFKDTFKDCCELELLSYCINNHNVYSSDKKFKIMLLLRSLGEEHYRVVMRKIFVSQNHVFLDIYMKFRPHGYILRNPEYDSELDFRPMDDTYPVEKYGKPLPQIRSSLNCLAAFGLYLSVMCPYKNRSELSAAEAIFLGFSSGYYLFVFKYANF